MSSGINCPAGTLVAIYLPNCPEWTIVEHALYMRSAVSVPLYDTLGSDAVRFILNHTQAPILVTGASTSQSFDRCRRNVRTCSA